MKKNSKYLGFISIALCFNANAFADDSGAANQDSADKDKLVIVVHALDQARNDFSTDIGGSSYTLDQQALDDLPQGNGTQLRDVMTRASGAEIDSYGQLHVRLDHADVQYRINGVILPSVGEGIGAFGDTLDTHFAESIKLIDGAFPVEYGSRVTSIIDLTTKSATDADGNGGRTTIMAGSNDTLQTNQELWGTQGKWTYYLSGTYNQSDRGVEPPTGANNAIHDDWFGDSEFGYASYVISPERRLSVILGNTTNRFEIPNNPGQTLTYTDASLTAPDSSSLDERQVERSQYGIVSLQGVYGDATNYQISLISRDINILFSPDEVGDLLYNGVSSRDYHDSFTNGLQGDASYRYDSSNTIRYGFNTSYEQAKINDQSVVFPSGQCNGSNVCSGSTELIDSNSNKDAVIFGTYLQDEWKALDKLTINYGARFDYYEAYISANQISPRVGATYDLTSSTQIHTGYARFFTPPPTDQVSPAIIQQFMNTTGELPTTQSSSVKPERDNYFDLGLTHKFTPQFTVGADAYYREAHNWLDESLLGNTLIRIPFNYDQARVKGIDFTADYKQGNFTSYANLTLARGLVKGISSGQFSFDQGTLDYVDGHWTRIDHDQLYSGSIGASYLYDTIKYDIDTVYGAGLRKGDFSTGSLPPHDQTNVAASHTFDFGSFGTLDTRFSIMNIFDRVYEIRDGTGVGVFAPQYGVRRTYFITISRPF